jgi:hypothetical protein
MFRWFGAAWRLALVAVFLGPSGVVRTAGASIADFRVNEVVPAFGGDGRIRYVELFVPPGTTANCLFPTTRIEVFDADGLLLGAATPFASTVCISGGSFFLLAPQAAAEQLGVAVDAPFGVAIPAFAGQVCFASSSTRYDCARWGPIGTPVGYLRDLEDGSSAAPIPDGQALARVGDGAGVAIDFALQAPTPGRANDGAPYLGPDAGAPPDAAILVDAGTPDARTFARPDARPLTLPDAFTDPRFLSADPGGGGCSAGGRPSWLAVVSLLGLLARGGARRRAAPRARGRASGRAACRSPR